MAGVIMKVSRTPRNNSWVLRLSGPLTAGDAVRQLRAVEDEVLAKPGQHLILDLERVDYLDAAGVGELIRLRQKAISQGGDLVVAGIQGKVREILGLTCVAEDLPVTTRPDQDGMSRSGPLFDAHGALQPN